MFFSGHCLVKDESATIEYAVKSVIDQLDEICVWVDPATTDDTRLKVVLLQEQYPDKIRIVEFSRPMKNGLFDKPKARTMLYQYQQGDVLFKLDGDEVYSSDAIKLIVYKIINSRHDVEAWNWYNRYFIDKTHFLDHRLMTMAIRMTTDLHWRPVVIHDYPEKENIDWIRDIPAKCKGAITDGKWKVRTLKPWFFHFPYRSSPVYNIRGGTYEGAYPEVFPVTFDYALLFPSV